MGRRSVKENKNIYQELRESKDLTRDEAAELLEVVSSDRIEKIENGKITPQPEDVMAMSKGYKSPTLCNYYCSNECAIGRKCVHEANASELTGIVLETLAALNSISKSRERLIEITADGEIDTSEIKDYVTIKNELERISTAVESMQLWTEQMIADGKIDQRAYKQIVDASKK